MPEDDGAQISQAFFLIFDYTIRCGLLTVGDWVKLWSDITKRFIAGVTSGTPRYTPFALLKNGSRRREKKKRLRRDAALGNAWERQLL
ncbi:MAG TPA: hypothetical protein PLU68_10255, partial [Thermotogota bacterium]|nr:hypothetical protein [Thermotogota bacterium]